MKSTVAALALTLVAATVQAQQIESKKSLTLDGAQKIIAAAVAEAKLKVAPGEDAIDVLKVDKAGNVSGPGGIWILSPAGKYLGMIVGPEHAHNFTFGDADGRTLYMAARTGIYRIRLNIEGIRP